MLRRKVHFVGRIYADQTAATWARKYATALEWLELSPVKWVAELGGGPVSPAHPDVACRRLLVRSTGARHRCGYTAIVTDLPAEVLPAAELKPFYEARQTIEGWLAEATAALQLKGLWSRRFWGLRAFLLFAALASNLLNWWQRSELLPATGRALLGLRQLVGRVITLITLITLPARLLRSAEGQLSSRCCCRRLTPLRPPSPAPHPLGHSRSHWSNWPRVMRIYDA